MAIESRIYRFANNARSTLAEAISASADSLRVQSGDGILFPEFDPVYDEVIPCILWTADLSAWEVVYVTDIDEDTLTIERGAEGSTPRAFDAGAIIVNNVTAGFFQQQADTADFTQVPAVEDDGECVTITWTEPVITEGNVILGYEIWRSTNGGAYELIATVSSETLVYEDCDVTLFGNTYYYYVKVNLLFGVDPATYLTPEVGTPTVPLLVAVAATTVVGENKVAYSSDGINWTAITTPPSQEWTIVDWFDSAGLFIAGAGFSIVTSSIMTSPDGINWTLRNNGLEQRTHGLAYSPSLDLIVAAGRHVGSAEVITTSVDGITWGGPFGSGMGNNRLGGIDWSADQSKFIVFASVNDRFWTSSDGENWSTIGPTNVTSDDSGEPYYIRVKYIEDFGLWVSASFFDGIFTSPDGTTWTNRASAVAGEIAYSPSLGMAVVVARNNVGGTSHVYTTTDGVTWTGRVAQPGQWRGIVWAPGLGLFVAVAEGGTNQCMTSPDGITWTARTIPGGSWQSVCVGFL